MVSSRDAREITNGQRGSLELSELRGRNETHDVRYLFHLRVMMGSVPCVSPIIPWVCLSGQAWALSEHPEQKNFSHRKETSLE